METQSCLKCKKEISARIKFCPHCGTRNDFPPTRIESPEAGTKQEDVLSVRTRTLHSVFSFEKRVFISISAILVLGIMQIFLSLPRAFPIALFVLAPSILMIYISMGLSSSLWRRIIVLLALTQVALYFVVYQDYIF